MNILCICSQKGVQGVSPVIKKQIESLRFAGLNVDVFGIKGKGIKGYFKAIIKLSRIINKQSYDIYHAHYGLSAIVATLAGARPLVVSLMGSDVKGGGWQTWLIKKFAKRRWDVTITKSKELAEIVGVKRCQIIPNGVDLSLFKPMQMNECRSRLGLKQDLKYVLFAANPNRPEKNFDLAKKAFDRLKLDNTELIYFDKTSHKEVPYWMNAVDVVVLSSLWEGSPNVIKEAMACNRPVLSTKVGDVEWLFKNCSGCFLSKNDVNEYADTLKLALDYSKKTGYSNGRSRIAEIGLDSKEISEQIMSVYKGVK